MPPIRKAVTPAALRKFGFVMAGAFFVLGLVLLWSSSILAPYLLGVGAAFLAAGALFPRVLAPIERGWMKFAEVLSGVMTVVILTLTFFLVITPIGLLRRVLGKDSLGLKFGRKSASYWVPVASDGPGSRPDKPF